MHRDAAGPQGFRRLFGRSGRRPLRDRMTGLDPVQRGAVGVVAAGDHEPSVLALTGIDAVWREHVVVKPPRLPPTTSSTELVDA